MVESLSERASDGLARIMGSWKFVLLQALFLAVWFSANLLLSWSWRWDPYPFILANLVMSAQAAFTAPIIMMSQNRAAAQDRSTLHADLKLDEESLRLIQLIEERSRLLLSRDDVNKNLEDPPDGLVSRGS